MSLPTKNLLSNLDNLSDVPDVEPNISSPNISSEQSSSSSSSSRTSTPSTSLTDDSASDDDFEDEDENSAEFDYFICKKENLSDLLRLCRECHQESCEITYKTSGAEIKATADCLQCGHIFTWSNSKMCESNEHSSKKKLVEIDLDLSTSIFITGSSFSDVKNVMNTLDIPFFGRKTYDRLKKKYVYQAIDEEYEEMTKFVFETIAKNIENKGPMNAAGDAQFDTPGKSAMRCKYVVLDCATKFVVSYATMKKNHGESSPAMETILHREAMKKLLNLLDSYLPAAMKKINSLTTDRNKSVSKTMATDFPNIILYYDSWHLLRNFVLDLMKKQSQKQFIPLVAWIRSFVNHVYYSIQSSDGNGELAKERVLSFFAHVQNVHDHFENLAFYKFKLINQCAHLDRSDDANPRSKNSDVTLVTDIDEDEKSDSSNSSHSSSILPGRSDGLDPQDPDDSSETSIDTKSDENSDIYYLDLDEKTDKKAWDAMMKVVTKGSRLDDLEKVSPLFTTSAVESFNGRSCHFTRKCLFYSNSGFDKLTKISIIDWNEKQKDELFETRKVIGERTAYCKTRKMKVNKTLKTEPEYRYLKSIRDRARKVRLNEIAGDEMEVDDDSEESGNEELAEYNVEILIADAQREYSDEDDFDDD